MDLSRLEALDDAETYDFELRDPATNAPLMMLILAGPTHPAMLKLKRKTEKNLSGSIKRSRDVQKALSNTLTEVLDDEDVALEREMERLMTGTVGWKGMEKNGQPYAYDAQVMENLYRKKTWLRNTVSSELLRAENFTRNSASS